MEQFVPTNGNETVAISIGSTVWTGLTFTAQAHPHPVINSSRDRNIQFNLSGDVTPSVAVVAGMDDDLALASADRASRLHPQDASRLQDLSFPAALLTNFGAGAGLTACGVASITGLGSLKSNGLVNALGRFFQRQFHIDTNV